VAGPGAAAAAAERVGVLLLNLGGPETLDDVAPFLYNLFADPDIIRLPPLLQWSQPLVARVVSGLRAPKSREGYEAIGGGSPLRDITEQQAAALRDALHARGVDAHTYVAMRYWKPFTGAPLRRRAAEGDCRGGSRGSGDGQQWVQQGQHPEP
jgi:ferrochelatase